MKTKLEFEVEAPDGATHYSGDPADGAGKLTYYKRSQDGGWQWWWTSKQLWMTSIRSPHWLKELPKLNLRTIPPPGDERARGLIEGKLSEYGYPANPQNAARAGWEACRTYAVEAGLAVRQPAPSILEGLEPAKSEGSKDHSFQRVPGVSWHPV